VELYWLKRGGGLLGASGQFWQNRGWGNLPPGAVFRLRALTSCCALTTLMVLSHKSL